MPRPAWSSLPSEIKDWAAAELGGRIVSARSQIGGFSPGTADVVRTETGRVAFVKAVGASLTPRSPAFHRTEAGIAARLDPSVPAPRLLAHFDDGDWVALIFEVVDGDPPQLPWTTEQLRAALDACVAISGSVPPRGLPRLRDEMSHAAGSWGRLGDRLGAVDPSGLLGFHGDLAHRLGELAQELDRLDGDALVHSDLRADNVLIDRGGRAIVVDWPWATLGPPWLDAVTLLFNARLYDPAYPVERELREHPAFAGAGPDDVNALLALLSGFFFEQSLKPPQPGVEKVRGFQRAQGVAIVGWLRERGF